MEQHQALKIDKEIKNETLKERFFPFLFGKEGNCHKSPLDDLLVTKLFYLLFEYR